MIFPINYWVVIADWTLLMPGSGGEELVAVSITRVSSWLPSNWGQRLTNCDKPTGLSPFFSLFSFIVSSIQTSCFNQGVSECLSAYQTYVSFFCCVSYSKRGGCTQTLFQLFLRSLVIYSRSTSASVTTVKGEAVSISHLSLIHCGYIS